MIHLHTNGLILYLRQSFTNILHARDSQENAFIIFIIQTHIQTHLFEHR